MTASVFKLHGLLLDFRTLVSDRFCQLCLYCVTPPQRGQCILFSVVFTRSPSHHGSVLVLPVISLLLPITHMYRRCGLPNHMMGEISWDS
jgi:hypothetical protein